MLNLKTGDILHCSGKSWLSKLIKLFTRSNISHSALFVYIYDKPYVIDAQNNGVEIKPFYDWIVKYNYDIIATRLEDIKDEPAFLERALSKVGITSYDFKALLIKQPIKLILGEWNYKGKYQEDKSMTCSEYVGWVYKIENEYKLTPQDIYAYCVNHNAEVVFTR